MYRRAGVYVGVVVEPHEATNSSPSAAGIRRLAVIAVADVVGYSRLMGHDDSRTLTRWMRIRTRTLEPVAAQHRGILVKTTGDGVILEFPSALDAVRWACEVQAQLAEPDADTDPSGALRLRIAIHIGNVIAVQDDLYGDGVNIAFRLQESGEPGQVIVSGAVFDLVQSAYGQAATDLGMLSLKNIDRPVRAYSIRPSSRAGASLVPALQTNLPSIAVLPLRVLSGRSEDRYIAEGFAHDVVASIAGLQELFVISASSTVAFVEGADVASFARQLGVRYLVTGNLSHAGNRLRMVIELSEVETRSVLWTDRYDVEESELFAVQDTIASKVAYSLLPHLHSSTLRHALRKPPDHMDAYELVLQALSPFYRYNPEDMEAARSLLLRAAERDPGYALPHALLAKWQIVNIGQGYSPDHQADAKLAAEHAERALERNGTEALALAIAGHVQSFLFGNYLGAIEAFDQAISSCPNSAVAWILSSPTYSYLGDGPTAVKRAEFGRRLSPLDPHASFYHTALTLAHYTNGSYEEAVHWGQRILASGPRFTANMRPLIGSLVCLGRTDEAREVARRMLAVAPSFRVGAFITRYPIRDPARKEKLVRELLSAGLPE